VASAQATVAAAGRAVELVLGGSWEGPMSIGTADANFLNNSGGDFAQFTTTNGLGQAIGLEVNLGFGLTRRLRADASGGWTHVSLRTEITDDFEGADGVTLKEPGSRFLVGGGIRLLLSDRKKMTWFVRGSVAWMRETAGGNTLTADGLLTSAGVGVDYLWRDRVAGGIRRTGLRIDGRVNFRSGGLTLGEDELRVGPAVAALIILGLR
jgi:hypothetical protein